MRNTFLSFYIATVRSLILIMFMLVGMLCISAQRNWARFKVLDAAHAVKGSNGGVI
jgi:hypothetical protein